MPEAGSSKHDPRLTAMHFAISDDLICDSANRVSRDGKSHARIGAGAEEARIDGGIGLNEIFVLLNSQIVPVQGANDSGGHRLTDQKRVADREDEITDLK